MTGNRFAAFTIAAALAAPAAVADVTIEYAGPDGERVSAFRVTDGKLRMDSYGRDHTSVLFDASERALTVLEHGPRRYTVVRESDMQQLRAQMERALDMARSAGMSAEQLQAMFPDGMERFEVLHRRTGETRSVEGIDCEMVDTLVNGEHESSSCIAPEPALGFGDAESATMERFTDMLASMTMEVLPSDVFSIELTEMDGIPVRTYHPDGSVRETLSGVSSDALDASVFEVPAGFSRQQVEFGP